MGRDIRRPMRPPRQRDLFGGEAEELLRRWLAEQGQTLSPKRILEYEERRDRSLIRKYRELDAVIESGRTLHVVEMKASRTAHALRKAQAQLREIASALHLITPHVIRTILLVDTGIPTPEEIRSLMRSDEAPFVEPPSIESILAETPSLRRVETLSAISPMADLTHVLIFSVADIVALAGDQPLHLDWSDDDEEPPPLIQPPTTHTVGGDDDDDDDSPFAAALRRARKE